MAMEPVKPGIKSSEGWITGAFAAVGAWYLENGVAIPPMVQVAIVLAMGGVGAMYIWSRTKTKTSALPALEPTSKA